MPWKYFYPSSKALETASNTEFEIKFGRNIRSLSDFEISPVEGSNAKFAPQQLEVLKAEFWNAFVQSNIRDEMRSIVNQSFGGDCQWVAYTLADMTKRKVSNRTVQAWLMEPGKPSSRTCPEWALQALRTFVSSPNNLEHLERGRRIREQDSQSSWHSSSEVDSKHSVRIATNEILSEERRKDEWRQASFDSLPLMLHELEKRIERELTSMRNSLISVETALKDATSFEEFKLKALDAIRDKEVAQFLVRDTRRAIETHSNEFASDDGISTD